MQDNNGWFSRQLEFIAKESESWPEWRKKEASIHKRTEIRSAATPQLNKDGTATNTKATKLRYVKTSDFSVDQSGYLILVLETK